MPTWSNGTVRARSRFENVTTYNLDEYYPISPLDPNSYRAYMHRHLFSHVDIAPDHAPRAGWHCARGIRGRSRGGV